MAASQNIPVIGIPDDQALHPHLHTEDVDLGGENLPPPPPGGPNNTPETRLNVLKARQEHISRTMEFLI